MEEQFPRASKTEAGGTKMTQARSFSCNAPVWNQVSSAGNFSSNVKNNFFHGQNRFAGRKNPMPLLKKKQSNSDRQASPKGSPLSRVQDRCARWKNRSNTDETRLLAKRRNTRRNGPSVTTSHLFWQHPPRTTGALLPISQPISKFLGRKARREPRGGGGVSRTQSPKAPYR